MTAITGKALSARDAQVLRLAYQGLVKAGNDSVRAAWRFGQALDSFSDRYTQLALAGALGVSTGCISRYTKLHRAYQRPELALEAAEQLETYNIDIITALRYQLRPVEHGRALAGRHWTYVCRQCRSHDVGRVETDADGHPVEEEAGVLQEA